MKRLQTDVAVGAFVLVAFGLLLWGTFQLGAFSGWLGGSGRTLLARFDDVAGLAPETDVLIAGVSVGKVASIELEGRVARVALRIDDPAVSLPVDSLAAIRSRGMLGERVIEVVPGSSEQMLEPGGVLVRTRSATSVDTLVERLTAVADDAQQVSSSFRNALGGPEGEEAVREMVSNLRVLVADMRRVVEENEGRIDRIALNLESFSEDASEFARTQRERVARVIANLEGASGKLHAALDSLANVSAKIEAGEGSLGKLVSDEELYREVDAALGDARAALREVRRAAEETQEQIPATILTTLFGSLF